MTDSHSVYERNIAESGAGVSIINNSVYTGTEITFDFNESDKRGGALFATT